VFSKSSQRFSVFDPTGETWGVAQTYRVVTDAFEPTFTLVPMGKPRN
jgi:hypothetical protein